MIPLIDSTKTTGLIFFPGTMVGMLLAGASPVDAVRLQLVLLYVLLGAVALAALLAVLLSRRAFFTAEHQLREVAPPQSTLGARAEPGSSAKPPSQLTSPKPGLRGTWSGSAPRHRQAAEESARARARESDRSAVSTTKAAVSFWGDRWTVDLTSGEPGIARCVWRFAALGPASRERLRRLHSASHPAARCR
jgi:hypothetical protein